MTSEKPWMKFGSGLEKNMRESRVTDHESREDSGFGKVVEVLNSKSTNRGSAMLPHSASDPPLNPLQGGDFTPIRGLRFTQPQPKRCTHLA